MDSGGRGAWQGAPAAMPGSLAPLPALIPGWRPQLCHQSPRVDGASLWKIPERPPSFSRRGLASGSWPPPLLPDCLAWVGLQVIFLGPSPYFHPQLYVDLRGGWQRCPWGLRACSGTSNPWTIGRDPQALWGPQHTGPEGPLLPANPPRNSEEGGSQKREINTG